MADRFPSIEDFTEGLLALEILQLELLTSVSTDHPGGASNGTSTLDPAGAGDDFLARERAALGDDAAQFTSASDNAAISGTADDDLLGGGSYEDEQPRGEEFADFENSYPAVDTHNTVSLIKPLLT